MHTKQGCACAAAEGVLQAGCTAASAPQLDSMGGPSQLRRRWVIQLTAGRSQPARATLQADGKQSALQ